MKQPIVSTISDRCKRCYSCIRECPAKAIKVIGGQAAVLSERCIACGHCVKVCSQSAKQIASDYELVVNYFLPFERTIAVIAPSFAASFPDQYAKIPGAVRLLGFEQAVETAFGADLVSSLYLKEYSSDESKTIISSACPAVVNFIEKYYGELVPNLANIVSPMIAIGKYLKENIGNEIKIVFIGPCIAKLEEARDAEVEGIIDAVLTFPELKRLLEEKKINFNALSVSEFDAPHAYMGKSYPLAGGLLKTADISDDILEKEIIVVEGKKKVVEIIDELSNKEINAKFVDILFCEGCISGPAIGSNMNYYSRREKVIQYISQKVHSIDKQLWKSNLYNSRHLDLTRKFSDKNQRKPYPSEEKIKVILAETNKFSVKDELNCGACGYDSCREYAVAIAKDLAEKEMCLPFLIDKLARAYDDLNLTQEQLRIAERLASIGQLAAGVAHEINNPLGTILLYSSMLKNDFSALTNGKNYTEDLELIVEEANRCKNIVSNLLNFARQGKLNIKEFRSNKMFRHILKTISVNPAFNGITITTEGLDDDSTVEGDQDQLTQVFLNIINNACEAMEESQKKELHIKLYFEDNYFITEIKDAGVGIPRENFSKVFTPFFTTKKIGKGTGLGLAITYGIVKMHRGYISFQSEEGIGTQMKVKLPVKQNIRTVNVNESEVTQC